MDENNQELLKISLTCAVPLWIETLKNRPWADLEASRHRCIDMIASHGDNILYRSKKAGETARAFNALAEALAILSFVPGGVRAFGLHFEARHPDRREAEV